MCLCSLPSSAFATTTLGCLGSKQGRHRKIVTLPSELIEVQAGHFDGVEPVPGQGCVPRTPNAPGVDFMTGGLPGQATQDPSPSLDVT